MKGLLFKDSFRYNMPESYLKLVLTEQSLTITYVRWTINYMFFFLKKGLYYKEDGLI